MSVTYDTRRGAVPELEFLAENQQNRMRRVQAMLPGRQLLHVFVLSAWGLFIELLLIRWLDAQIRPLAYVKNLPLIGCFLGLGVGYALSGRRRSLFPVSVLLLCLLFLVAMAPMVLGEAWLVSGPEGPESNLGLQQGDAGPFELFKFYATIAIVFALTVLATVPIGQITGSYMSGLPSLRAYTLNVAGSLAGIVLFAGFSALYVPPFVSALLALGLGIAYLRARPAVTLASVLLALITCAAMGLADYSGPYRTMWSPYNRIQLRSLGQLIDAQRQPISESWMVLVQHLYFQRMLDLSPRAMRDGANISDRRRAASLLIHPLFPARWTHSSPISTTDCVT